MEDIVLASLSSLIVGGILLLSEEDLFIDTTSEAAAAILGFDNEDKSEKIFFLLSPLVFEPERALLVACEIILLEMILPPLTEDFPLNILSESSALEYFRFCKKSRLVLFAF